MELTTGFLVSNLWDEPEVTCSEPVFQPVPHLLNLRAPLVRVAEEGKRRGVQGDPGQLQQSATSSNGTYREFSHAASEFQ